MPLRGLTAALNVAGKEHSSVAESAFGIYLYGIVPGDQPLPAKVGIDGLHPLYMVTWEQVGAVASQVSLAEFDEAPLQEKLQDLCWLETKLRAHEAIVEEVMRLQPILPCKLCTIYRLEARVREILAQHYRQYLDALAFLRDKEEWGVKVFVDEEILRNRLLQTDAELQRMEQERMGKPPGLAYLLQKTLVQRLTVQVEQALAHLSGRLVNELRAYALQAEEMSSSISRPSSPGLRMIFNTAYLISKEKVLSFIACTQALNERLANEGIRLVLSGPWPPYHFSPKLQQGES